MRSRKVLLLEPNYLNKYPPMGLMKLATYFRERGDDVRFFKGDLKDYAAKLLCEEFFHEVQCVPLAKYESKIFQFIKTGQFIHLESIPDFIFSKKDALLRTFRQRYVTEDFPPFDIICITTLFTFYWKKTINTINESKKFLKPKGRILVGGIASSLLPEKIRESTEISPICGQLNKKGIIDKDTETIIDELSLDYSILEEIDYKYPAKDSYFAYMTRGCPNRCAFCAVPQLEKKYRDYVPLKSQIEKATALFGEQKDLLLLDNNVLASKRFNRIIDEIKACGFQKGAKYTPPNEYDVAMKHLRAKKKENRNVRVYTHKMIALYDKIAEILPEEEQAEFYLEREKNNLLYPLYAEPKAVIAFDAMARPLYEKHFIRSARSRYIDFNQGIDARLVTEEKMKKLSELNIRPLRIAFDHLSMRKTYIKAVRLAAKYGIRNLSNYLLYNYNDTPDDLYGRMKINIDLCDELGIAIYSFPMKYHPINDSKYFDNRDYIGKHWNRKFIRAVQSVLNSTKGKIGRSKSFFEEAFGSDLEGFHQILWMPEAFIIHRFRYKENETRKWWKQFNALDDEQSKLAQKIIAVNDFSSIDEIKDKQVRSVLGFYKKTR